MFGCHLLFSGYLIKKTRSLDLSKTNIEFCFLTIVLLEQLLYLFFLHFIRLLLKVISKKKSSNLTVYYFFSELLSFNEQHIKNLCGKIFLVIFINSNFPKKTLNMVFIRSFGSMLLTLMEISYALIGLSYV